MNRILYVSVVVTAAALAWSFITLTSLFTKIYFETATLMYICFTIYILTAMNGVILLLWSLLGKMTNDGKQ